MSHRPLSVAGALALLLLTACADQATNPLATPTELEPSAAGAPRQDNIPTRAQERPGTFVDMTDDDLWRHIAHAGNQAVVGLKAAGTARGTYQGEVLIDAMRVSQARQAVANQRGIRVLAMDDRLPLMEVRIESRTALASLRQLPIVDYVEPFRAIGDIDQWASFGGCGWGNPWGGEQLLSAPTGDRFSARFASMRIPQAWDETVGGRRVNGEGITIGLTDTGVAALQGELRAGFSGGTVPRRTVRHFFLTSFSSSDDACGHGTRMAGVIAAPDDGRGVMGVAWGANLVSVRQADGVANISTSAARGSIRAAGDASSKIITMPWQSMNWWWSVSDEIKWWHRNRGVLFVAAAGTSGCGDGILDSNVVFPAQMAEVVAVTGMTYPSGSVPCGIHYGKQVELTAYLDVPTTGRILGEVTTIGGSSNATAIVAGIAALTWQANPHFTRDQVRQRLQESGALFPVRSGSVGFGLLNAHRAVTGL